MATATTRQEGLDKFYTIPSVAKECLRILGTFFPWDSWDRIIEPSAGNGNFFLQIPSDKKIGMDIAPEHSTIQTQNFFEFSLPSTFPSLFSCPKVLVVGNPPFGRVSSLALKFFNHAAKFSTVIAFVLPRTFRRISLQNKMDPSFHCIHDSDIPLEPCAFDPPMRAKCCFQIWEKRSYPRDQITLSTTHHDWTFLPYGPFDKDGQPTPPSNADFAIRAYGGACGEIRTDALDTLRPKSWHWIKSNIDKDTLIERFSSLDYSVSQNTARQNSIGRGELVFLYTHQDTEES